MVQDDFKQITPVALAHAWIGLVVVIASTGQVALGWYADKKYDPQRMKTPLWPDKVHWYLGRFTILSAVVAIFLGMVALEISDVFIAVFAAWCGTFVIAFIVFQCVGSTTHHVSV